MNINQLKYVTTIAKTKNFSEAAKILYISQPALSQYIKKLEEDMGVKLFTRDKTEVNITDEGREFIYYAEEILKLHRELLIKMESFSSKERKKLTLGISQFYGKYFIPKLIPEFVKLCPEAEIKIIESESKIIEENLLKGEVDIAIVPMPVYSTKVKYKTLYRERFSIAINFKNKKLELLKNCDKIEIDISILKNKKFVLLNKGLKLRELAETICLDYGFKPIVALESENLDTLNSLVHNNIGVSILPSMIAKYSDVEYIEFVGAHSERNTILAYVNDEFKNIVDKIPEIEIL